MVAHPELSTTPLQPNMSITSKSPKSWTKSDLSYFKIQPSIATSKTFFGKQAAGLRDFQLADPGYEAFLTANALECYPSTDAAGQDVKAALTFIRQIRSGDRSAGVKRELAAKLLGFVGMDMSNTISYRRPTNFIMCKRSFEIQVDMVLINSDYPLYLFLFVEVKLEDPVPQLLATGIAAFQWNNYVRNLKGVASFKTMIFPAMTLRGSSPCFYLLRITEALSEAVIVGVSPNFVTPVFRYIPVNSKLRKFGLFHVKARGRVLRVLENMKDFIPTGIDHVPEGWLRFLTEEDIYEPTSSRIDLDLRFLTSWHDLGSRNPAVSHGSRQSLLSHPSGSGDTRQITDDRNRREASKLEDRVSTHTSSHLGNPPSRSRSRGPNISRNHIFNRIV